MNKLFYLDLETTGLNPEKHGIIQISAIIEIEGMIKDTFNYKVAPFNDDLIDGRALETNGLKHEDIIMFQDPSIIYNELINLLNKYVDQYNRDDKFWIVGYNSIFDDNFFRKWFRKNNNKYYGSYFRWPPLSIEQLIAFKTIKDNISLDRFRLCDVAEYLGINIDKSKAHDSMYDINKTREIFMKIRGII